MTPQETMKNLDEPIGDSPFFTWGEALWMDRSGAYALPNISQISNIIATAKALTPVRAHFGREIRVLSWLRTPAHNALIKGALKSAHLEGLAVDFIIPGLDVHKVQEELSKNTILWPYRVEQLTPTWVHVDTRLGPRIFYP